MLRSVTRFIKNVVKAKIENIFAIALVLLVLFTAMMDPYISFSIAVALLVALAIYGFVKRQNKRGGIEMANQFERRVAK
jgi:O-antigen/teichoic acid export membrane protein